jgi:Tol biopolymer transport system component
MIGDLYCIPASEIDVATDRVQARAILRGVPYDSDPHFSPEGDRLVFRSDAELGVENIWITEWKGCSKMGLNGQDKGSDEELLLRGVKETPERMTRRLQREGRLGGMSILLLSSNSSLNFLKHNASQTRPSDGFQTPGSTYPVPK